MGGRCARLNGGRFTRAWLSPSTAAVSELSTACMLASRRWMASTALVASSTAGAAGVELNSWNQPFEGGASRASGAQNARAPGERTSCAEARQRSGRARTAAGARRLPRDVRGAQRPEHIATRSVAMADTGRGIRRAEGLRLTVDRRSDAPPPPTDDRPCSTFVRQDDSKRSVRNPRGLTLSFCSLLLSQPEEHSCGPRTQ